MVSPRRRREQVSFLRERGLSQRRACGLLDVPRSTMGYRLRQPEKNAPALCNPIVPGPLGWIVTAP